MDNKDESGSKFEINEVEEIEGLQDKVVLDGKLNMLLPVDFELMSKEMLSFKYPAGNRPTEVYSDEDGAINIAVNHTTNNMTLEQLPDFLPVFKKQFSSLYPTIKWYRKEIVKIKGQDFIILEFETPAIDTSIYNLMAISSLDERMLMGSFNCPVGIKGEWKNKANQIINSIKVKE